MAYFIHVAEQEAIADHTPEGMTPYSLQMNSEDKDISEHTGFFAPTGLFEAHTLNGQRQLCAWVAMEALRDDDSYDEPSGCSALLHALEEDTHALPSDVGGRLCLVQLTPLGESAPEAFEWPYIETLENLVAQGHALKRQQHLDSSWEPGSADSARKPRM